MKHLRSITAIGTAAIALSALLSQQTANAALLAYEGFDYTAGNLDTTKNGGFGWAAAWQPTVSGSIPTLVNNQQVFSTGFTYVDALNNSLNVAGGRAHVTANGDVSGDNIGGAGTGTSISPFRSLGFTRGNATETTWISFLGLKTGLPLGSAGQPPVAGDHIWGRASSLQVQLGTSERFAIGRGTQSAETTAPTIGLPNDTWGMLQQGSSSAVKASLVNWASAPADFILMRIDHVAGTTSSGAGAALNLVNPDTVRIWINPNLNAAPLDGAADITFNANDFNSANGVASLGLDRDFNFDRFRIFAGGANAVTGYGSIEMDEMRVGEAFADVTPYTSVPEPAMAAIGGLGVLVLVLRRRQS